MGSAATDAQYKLIDVRVFTYGVTLILLHRMRGHGRSRVQACVSRDVSAVQNGMPATGFQMWGVPLGTDSRVHLQGRLWGHPRTGCSICGWTF